MVSVVTALERRDETNQQGKCLFMAFELLINNEHVNPLSHDEDQ
jgi:hypothetical protein